MKKLSRLFRLWRRADVPLAKPRQTNLPVAARQWIERLPKAEIHLHFEGTAQAGLILRLARKYGYEPIQTRADAEWALYFSKPREFFEQFLRVSSLFREPEDFYWAARDLGGQFRSQNIRYAEITIAPRKFILSGVPYPELMDAICRGLDETWAGEGNRYRFVIDIVRDLGPEAGMETMRIVEANPGFGVAGVGLGGGENFPPEASAQVFEYAASLGLRKTAHAGEGRGPASIWGAIEHLNPERIDHGTRAREDARLVDYLAERQIPLNLCPTSNVMLGVSPSIEEHPFREYLDRGIPVNLGTDDPAFFKTTLGEEYARVVELQGVPLQRLPEIAANALRASFLPDGEKTALLEAFRRETEALTAELQPALEREAARSDGR